jgi:hypothetical protein
VGSGKSKGAAPLGGGGAKPRCQWGMSSIQYTLILCPVWARGWGGDITSRASSTMVRIACRGGLTGTWASQLTWQKRPSLCSSGSRIVPSEGVFFSTEENHDQQTGLGLFPHYACHASRSCRQEAPILRKERSENPKTAKAISEHLRNILIDAKNC